MSDADVYADILRNMPQEQKDASVYRAIDNGDTEAIKAVINAGGRTSYSDPVMDVLPWAMRRTGDLEITEVLLDAGLTAQNVTFKDLDAFFRDYPDDVWPLLARLSQAGLPQVERAEACVYAVQQGKNITEALQLATQEGEDAVSVIDAALRIKRAAHSSDASLEAEITQLCLHEKEKYQALFESHFSNGITTEKLADVIDAKGDTGLMLAIKAGHLKEAVTVMESANPALFDAAAITQKNAHGESALSLAGHRYELQTLFSPKLWSQHTNVLYTVIENMPPMFRNDIDTSEAIAASCASAIGTLVTSPAKKLALRKPQG